MLKDIESVERIMMKDIESVESIRRAVLESVAAKGRGDRIPAAEVQRVFNALDAANANLKMLALAAVAWDATLSDYCDGPERDAVRKAVELSGVQTSKDSDTVKKP